MNRYVIGSLWDRVNRNGANKNFEYLFEGRLKIDELNYRADSILTEAKKTNGMNKDVQNQLDNLIIESGNANAEVSQARGDAPLLKDRLDKTDAQLGQTDKELSKRRAVTKPKPMITIWSDDARLTDYTDLYPFLEARNVKCTIAVPPRDVGTEGYMTWEQIAEVHENGWSIQNHGYGQKNLANLTREQADEDVREGKRILNEKGYPVEHYAYPNGGLNNDSLEVVKKYHLSGATTANGTNLPVPESVHLRRVSIFSNTLDSIKSRIDSAVANDGWVIIYTHGDDFASSSALQTKLDEVITYARSQSVEFVTHEEGWENIGSVIDLGIYSYMPDIGTEKSFVVSKRGDVRVDGSLLPDYIKDNGTTLVGEANPVINKPITDYKNGYITYNEIDSAGSASYPESKAGILKTNYIVRWSGYPQQEYYPLATRRVYRRLWISGAWTSFELVSGSVEDWEEIKGTSSGYLSVGSYTVLDVTFASLNHPNQKDSNYNVLATPNWDAGGIWVNDTTATGFTFRWNNAPVSSGRIAYQIVRND